MVSKKTGRRTKPSEWPRDWDALKKGRDCPMCCERAGLETDDYGGTLVLSKPHADAYLKDREGPAGYVIVKCRGKTHVAELTELSPSELRGFMSAVMEVSRAINRTFKPIKLN